MSWSYKGENGPQNWCKLYSAANGIQQSPIDIESEKIKCGSICKQKLMLNSYDNSLCNLTNSGHSWKIDVENNDSKIVGGPLEGDYELIQIHAHWGECDNAGSEHTIDGERFSAEIHLVHWNRRKYPTIQEASQHQDGLCVLAVMCKLGNSHSEIAKIVEGIPKIMHKTDACKLKNPVNPKLLLPNDLRYWTYSGSLTTPPCSECVIWIVFGEAIDISHEQLVAFRTLRAHSANECDALCSEDVIDRNFRPTLPLGDRVIRGSL